MCYWWIYISCKKRHYIACEDHLLSCVFWQTVIFGAYLIAHGFFSVYNMGVDTLFLCFCKSHNHTQSCLICLFVTDCLMSLCLCSGGSGEERWESRETLLHVQEYDENIKQEEQTTQDRLMMMKVWALHTFKHGHF